MSDLKKSGKAVPIRPAKEIFEAHVYNNDLYIVENGIGLERIASTGTQVEVLPIAGFGTGPAFVSIVDDYVYFSAKTSGLLSRVPLANLSATPEIQAGTAHWPHVIRGDELYGVDLSGPKAQLWKQSFKTGEETVITLPAASDDFGDFDVKAGYAYYTDNTDGMDKLFRVSTEGAGVPEPMSGTHFALGEVRVIGDDVYWADGYRMYVTHIGEVDPKQATKPFGNFTSTGSITDQNGGNGGRLLTERGDRAHAQPAESVRA